MLPPYQNITYIKNSRIYFRLFSGQNFHNNPGQRVYCKVHRKSGIRGPKSSGQTWEFCSLLWFVSGLSSHDSHVVHCASRNYTWKADFFCVMDGVGHFIENSAGRTFAVITYSLYHKARAIACRKSQRIIHVTILAGV